MDLKFKIPKKERRNAQRLNIPLKLEYNFFSKKGLVEKIFTQDVSGSGMRIRVSKPFEIGQCLQSKLYFPNSPRPLKVVSKVVWCRRVSGGIKPFFDVGIRYVRIKPIDRERFLFLFCEMMLNYFLFNPPSRNLSFGKGKNR